MEPLNLMVSLSHFANTKPKNQHGLSEPAGRGRRLGGQRRVESTRQPERARGSWRNALRGLTRSAGLRAPKQAG